MSNYPPPPMPQPGNYGMPQQRPANVFAIVSLICGIIGCLVITPLIAIVTGVVGLGQARARGGRGMAVTGILLGLLWCVGGAAVIGGGVWAWHKKDVLLAQVAKPQAMLLINRAAAGNTKPDATTGTLTEADLQAVAAEAKPLGNCHDITVSRSSLTIHDKDVTLDFGGTALFANGSKSIDARVKVGDKSAAPGGLVFEKLELK